MTYRRQSNVLNYSFSLLVFVSVFFASKAYAQFEEPEGLSFSYYGYLEGLDGEPVDGFIPMEFRLYAEPEFGFAEWEEINPGVEVVRGYFTVELGRMEPVPRFLVNNPELFLGVVVNGGRELTPRYRIGAVLRAQWARYAEYARNLEGVSTSGGFVGIAEANPQSELHVNGTVRAFELCDTVGANCVAVADLAAGGLEGPPGPEGPAGPPGRDGQIGPAGPAGADGAQGPAGRDGPIGPAGPAGADGAQGPAGRDGPIGPAGPAGADGAQGPAGAEGPIGRDGPIGPAGPQGPAGADGAQGPAGRDGPMGPAGPAGADGVQGPAGPAGADGAQGPAGPEGPVGRDGPIGPAGPAGADGAQGPAGPEGPVGRDGPIGPAGPQGPAGADGAQGLAGPEGPIGPAGPAGADGAQGPAGPQGPQGEPGTTVTEAAVTQEGRLAITLSSGAVLDAGDVVGPPGDDAPGCTISPLEVDGNVIVGAVVMTCGDQPPIRLQAFLCGNGQVDFGETCDDGNLSAGDGCNSLCQFECGNGQIDAGEQCDDGNRVDTDACTATCQNAVCGDGIIQTGVEACDGGNGCRDDCTEIPCQARDACPDIEFVEIQGGQFAMGYAEGRTSEQPVHDVNVPTFEIMRHEVTVGQYAQCVAQDACDPVPAGNEFNSNRAGTDRLPVNGVSWFQARQFAVWFGARLPTEAEWEFAARSRGLVQRYPWGNEAPDCERTHNYTCDGDEHEAVCAHPTGNSAQGVCDLAGNAWEWVEDQNHRTYEGAPADGTAWCDNGDCETAEGPRVWRGGDFKSDVTLMRNTARGYYAPTVQFSWMGFRLARDL